MLDAHPKPYRVRDEQPRKARDETHQNGLLHGKVREPADDAHGGRSLE